MTVVSSSESDDLGNTVLTFAVRLKSNLAVETLIADSSADINLENSSGVNTALFSYSPNKGKEKH